MTHAIEDQIKLFLSRTLLIDSLIGIATNNILIMQLKFCFWVFIYTIRKNLKHYFGLFYLCKSNNH